MLNKTRLIVSLSDDVKRLCELSPSDVQCAKNIDQNPLVNLSHSAQLSWQFHALSINHQLVVMAVESYSRYVLLLPFLQAPTWQQIHSSFLESYHAELTRCFEQGGFMRWHQRSIVQRNFQTLPEPLLINCLLSDEVELLSATVQQGLGNWRGRPAELSTKLKEQADKLNQKPYRLLDQQRDKVFFPLERFLGDSLYRFGGGLCDVDIPGCKAGEFPNPYRANADLCVVRG